jgi:hypothetical protein
VEEQRLAAAPAVVARLVPGADRAQERYSIGVALFKPSSPEGPATNKTIHWERRFPARKGYGLPTESSFFLGFM